jgi:hypothetical protein
MNSTRLNNKLIGIILNQRETIDSFGQLKSKSMDLICSYKPSCCDGPFTIECFHELTKNIINLWIPDNILDEDCYQSIYDTIQSLIHRFYVLQQDD